MENTDKTQVSQPLPRLNDFSPNTMMILGAALSGGDPLKMAVILLKSQEKIGGTDNQADV